MTRSATRPTTFPTTRSTVQPTHNAPHNVPPNANTVDATGVAAADVACNCVDTDDVNFARGVTKGNVGKGTADGMDATAVDVATPTNKGLADNAWGIRILPLLMP